MWCRFGEPCFHNDVRFCVFEQYGFVKTFLKCTISPFKPLMRLINSFTHTCKWSTQESSQNLASKVAFPIRLIVQYEPELDNIKQKFCASSEDSDQPGHPSNWIRAFAVSNFFIALSV